MDILWNLHDFILFVHSLVIVHIVFNRRLVHVFPGICILIFEGLQCFDAVGCAAGRASGLQKKQRWGAGMVICLERGANLHMAQLMPLPLTVSCFSKIPIGFTFLVPAHHGSPGQRAVKRVCVVF